MSFCCHIFGWIFAFCHGRRRLPRTCIQWYLKWEIVFVESNDIGSAVSLMRYLYLIFQQHGSFSIFSLPHQVLQIICICLSTDSHFVKHKNIRNYAVMSLDNRCGSSVSRWIHTFLFEMLFRPLSTPTAPFFCNRLCANPWRQNVAGVFPLRRAWLICPIWLTLSLLPF